jgi:hypothetical protein
VPLPVAAEWKLQAGLVLQTAHRLSLESSSSDGFFAALAGRSTSEDKIQILLNNYQPDYDIAREIAARLAPLINASTAAYPLVQANGLFNGEEACFNPGTQFFVPVCQTYVQATIRNNRSHGYDVVIEKLPWGKSAKYRVEVQRVGGGSVHRVVSMSEEMGKVGLR